ncbi:MAG: DUF5131 family protein [Archangium sp.]|nr:DUF5131 family protein [Archangium sp.]
MADQREGGIAWTEQTWNPVRGCTRISEGCRNCYAEVVAGRFSDKGLAYEGLAKRTAAGPRWTGVLQVVDKHMSDPIRWRRPRRIFVNSMSDLFHEKLEFEVIARVFAVMYLSPHHTFQVLTKRADRMRDFLNHPRTYAAVLNAAREFRAQWPALQGIGISDPTRFPHRNVWLGVSVEDQKAAEKRIPALLGTPAAVRWLSVEPQIGAVDLRPWLTWERFVATTEASGQWSIDTARKPLDWVVIGGESGDAPRPFHVEWARELIAQCQGAGTKVFMKQLGARPTVGYYDDEFELFFEEKGWEWPAPVGWSEVDGQPGLDARVDLRRGRKSDDLEAWPPSLRVREYPEARR